MSDDPWGVNGGPFVLRLTLEHMQYQILQAIMPREVELKERITEAVNKAIKAFDFQGEIERQVRNQVNSTISGWVRASVENTVHISSLQKTIQAEVERQLQELEQV